MRGPDKFRVEKGREKRDIAAEDFLAEMVDTEHFSGVAMVTRGGQPIHKRAYGPASVDRDNHVDGRFHVGSIAKQFTAAAIMQLIEAEAVQLDGRINDYLPEGRRSQHWDSVNVAHLLSHSSGIPDYAVARDYYAVVDGWAFGATVDGMIHEAIARPLDFRPGSQFHYCNLGYTLLGEIIEAQSGLRYADYIRQELLLPFGLENSEVHDECYSPRPGDATGLRWDDHLGRHVKDDVVSLPVTPADGGLITTLDDFALWTTAFKCVDHPALSKTSLERMLAQGAPTNTYRWPERNMRGPGFYGLGLMRSGDLVMHEGSIVGFRSFFIYSQHDDLLVAVFANNSCSDVFRIASVLFSLFVATAE